MIQMIVGRVLKELKDWIPSKLPTPDIIGSTANRYCSSIIEHLKDPSVHKIGVWGMGGVGKTCIARNVFNRLHEESNGLFHHIILVSVPYECSLKDVRNEIGKQLLIRNLLDEENELKAAAFLKQRLYKKKFLLILDDLWRSIYLQELGVPEPTQDNGCKVLVTTRNRGVCHSMDMEKEVQMVPLPQDEACELFNHKVGELSGEIEPIVRKIAVACGGLPLAIVTVAESLRNQRDILLWRYAYNDLINSRPLNQKMKVQVFDHLKLSYDRLENQTLKDCFISCVFLIDKFEFNTDDVVQYFVAEGLLEIQDNVLLFASVADGFVLLSKLKEVSLLEECDKGQCVRINEAMRCMAQHMISGSRFISKSISDTEDPPPQQKWEAAEKISLRVLTKISRLSMSPNCNASLNTLMLNFNFTLKHISDNFFQHMESLRVLDLSFTSLSELPASLSCLASLQFLSLEYCQSLKTIDHVGDLKRLLFLNLRASAIEKLPKEISKLKKLRVLRLVGTVRLKEIESGAISELSSLEWLLMRGSAYAWSLEGTSTGTSLGEIEYLPHLQQMSLKVSGENDFQYIREAAILNKWNGLYNLYCYVQESGKLMTFDVELRTWKAKVEKDPMQEYIKNCEQIAYAGNVVNSDRTDAIHK